VLLNTSKLRYNTILENKNSMHISKPR